MNLDIFVILWTAFAVFAGCTSIYLINQDIKSFQVIRQAIKQQRAVKWGPKWWIALGFLVADALFLTGWIGFGAIGVVAFITPPPGRARQPFEELMTIIFVGVEGDFAIIQGWWWYIRRKLRQLSVVPTTPDEAAPL